MGVEHALRADDPAVSVVVPSIPAYDHGPTVDRLLAQTLDRPYEVLVVDDGTVDRSTARNRGLRAASADVVALTDDDIAPPHEWLAVVHRTFADDPDLVCAEGPVYGGCRNHDARHYVGCNLAVRREQALDVGGFRPAFSEWREDVEFGWRMERDADGECRYVEAMRMCHPAAPRTAFKPDLERRLAREYPDRYDAVMNATPARRLYRKARALGLTQPVHRALNAVRRRTGVGSDALTR